MVIVEDGEITDSYYHLICPLPNYYTLWTTAVHGLTFEDTAGAPTFPDVWAEIAPKIRYLPLVAHNKAFDESCLKAVFKAYGMQYPDYKFYCRPLRCNAAIVFRNIITRSPTQRLVHTLP